jgi:uncharacterized phage protein (TIGR02218 family)
MKTASAGLIAFLANNSQYYMADLYTFTMVNGYVARYTNFDQNITIGGNTFISFGIKRSQVREVVGLEVDTLTVEVVASPTDLLEGAPWLQAVRKGYLDGANVKLEVLYMPTPLDVSLGTIVRFQGRVSDASAGRSTAAIRVKSELELLNMQLPRNMFQSACANTLYDSACGLAKANFSRTGYITNAPADGSLWTSLTDVDQLFSLGRLVFTSGVNNGLSVSIRAYQRNQGAMTLFSPLVNGVAYGDTFIAYLGCDKMLTTCQNRFNNVVNFRGFPYIPDPETAT